MSHASPAQTVFPFGDQPDELSRGDRKEVAWDQVLLGAFADRGFQSGFLPLAEEAVRAQPGDGHILLLAATAALLDEDAARAQVFLKRFRKRYVAIDACYLLDALALAQQNRLLPARSLLDAHGLTDWLNVANVFPGGLERRGWLYRHYARIFEPSKTVRSRRSAAGPVPKAKTRVKPRPPTEGAVTPTIPASLPLIDIDIPFTTELNLAPLLDALHKPPNSDGALYGLRERFAHLGLAQGFDELLCLPHLRGIETFWYQVETVRKVLKQHRGRVLLADEVGLGKTVEAGMILKEYLLRGIVDSVLVLTPASLVGQWQEELESKFDIACATTHDALLRSDPEGFWRQNRLIASLALARRSEHAAHILDRSFDLVIVDEAHHLRDRTSQSYKLVDALNKRFVLLLSATPVQNDLTELYNLLTLLKPGIFKTMKEFRAAHVRAGKPRQPANPERLHELMRGAMVRNTRAVVALKLPRRHAVTICADGTEGELTAYRELEAAVRRLAAQGTNRLALRHLLGAAGSSPAAAAAAVRRLSGRHVDASWHALAQKWACIGVGGKEAALLDLLRRNPDEKKLVFVHYRETLEHLATLLAREGFAFARFEGALSGPAKDAAIAEFRERVPVLLCTESGGEGRNLQFCNTLINFDVPWNPMAIEQRIGRIDRIGQQREVFVFNLVTRSTLEQQILSLLDEKISMFELVVGEVGAILGGLDEDRDFADLMLDAWLRSTETGRAEALDALGRRLKGAREHHESAKALDTALFGDEFETV
ncbi:DEAD/DEAH box helicase [Bradyrhizobium sp. CCGUVB14]|uniref:DEAD/DEAH box helicase n=1 Tax=Bradyrhizobium sp. CCGUVB14 TaxID=2949628 RepID=UPI0020B2B533|nr:SNF2-related protein [Bradyrhizobium sp. CCGUVB14]MCP3441287.1 SNF2-related protein [Bradyrhizobium sp. CCGUVB14]